MGAPADILPVGAIRLAVADDALVHARHLVAHDGPQDLVFRQEPEPAAAQETHPFRHAAAFPTGQGPQILHQGLVLAQDQLVEQIFLVAEIAVYRALARIGQLDDLVQGRIRIPFAREHFLCRREQARFLFPLPFRSCGHAFPPLRPSRLLLTFHYTVKSPACIDWPVPFPDKGPVRLPANDPAGPTANRQGANFDRSGVSPFHCQTDTV